MKRIFLLLSLFFLIHIAHAQQNSLLWKVTGNGLPTPSYLFGTMHILCDQDLVDQPVIQQALLESQQLAMELNLSDPQILLQMQQLSVNPDFENIYKNLEKEDFQLLDEFLTRKYGSGLIELGILKPFALTSMIMMGFLACEEPFSIENHLAGVAAAREMPILGLETAHFQFGIFDQIPIDFQIGEIMRTLKDDTGRKELEEMMRIYASGDLDRLQEYLGSSEMMRTFQSLLLDDRNVAWIPQLEELFKQGPTFVAVGAAHLPGELGIISLLIKKGYWVEAISF